jgi:hypothetical protein
LRIATGEKTFGMVFTLMGSVRRAASEKIICSFAEQVEVRSSQSLQLRGIYDV